MPSNWRMASGLMAAGSLTQERVTLDMKFEPSIGILARKVDKLGADIRSFREPLLRIVKEVMIPSILTNFQVGGRPPWQPLQQETIWQKKNSKGGEQPLIRTGALMRTMSYINTWHIDREKALIAELPARVWYGGVHQAGTAGSVTRTVRNVATGRTETFTESEGDGIPARPFAVIQPKDIERMEMVMAEWVGERVRMAGLG